MNLFRTYKRALLMLMREGPAVYLLAIANAGIGFVQLAEPMLFGAIVDALAGSRPTSAYIVTWAVIGIVGTHRGAGLILYLPGSIFETPLLSIWLIAKGFTPSAIDSGPAAVDIDTME